MTICELNYKMVLRVLETKERLLKKIIDAPEPQTDNEILKAKCYHKVEKAKVFLDEIEEIRTSVAIALDVHMVSLSMMHKYEAKADFAELTFNGEYCKLMLIRSFPHAEAWLLYVPTLDTL